MTTTFYEVPVSAAPQSFSVSISGVQYSIRQTYCDASDSAGWLIDISDSSGSNILTGIPLVTGANLLGQFGYLGLGFSLVVTTSGNADAVPTYDNLGV
ncbi:phage baseplate plug family protein [Acetobacter sp.]|jgi:hypothetical protein|uniref:phage baseplate plug family protein n=1 Tax=Acetobacter sp. TaxID=440 RepID=UPI0025BF5CC6|nr:hypothetical protein [Acetobacter sp.]MCH4090719.1 hypothetical protein [Acetobacter sp.]MCI1300162.1 hypothetical protein [Acetobacter sp.]MCI1316580.1 hypothetical protein [Acetobacter sp.]